ncbi:MAG: diguanylate cyclase, partial [Campylobacterales bacterium]|nr:diguanylate cyclase [Campylobacterales bacterium]
TAHSDSDHLIKAIDIGITHYVVKPIDLKLLFSYLDKFKKQLFIEKELEETRELFESITTTSLSGIFVFNEKFTYTNPEFQKITGFSEEELLNKSFHEIFACQYQEKANEIVQLVKEHKKLDDNFFEGKISTKDGLEKWVHASVNTIKHKDDFIGTGSIIDISELKNLQEKLTRQANYDNLTKAINRHYFVEIYKHEATRSDRSQQPISLIILDIDHFKLVNDNYGHNIGDYILREMTNKITSTLRDSDSFIRWGGEEFIIFAPETDLKGASNIAEKVRKSIEEYSFKEVEKITISLGVVMRKVDESLETLVERADKNLYKAKETGRNRVVSE